MLSKIVIVLEIGCICCLFSSVVLVSAKGDIKCTNRIEKVDLAFVVDSSGSICDNDTTKSQNTTYGCNNWVRIKTFMKQIVRSFSIGQTKTRVGLVTFSNEGYVVFNFSSLANIDELIRAIDEIDYLGGNTNTSGGLFLMRTKLFSNTPPDRARMAFVITDGKATYTLENTTAELEATKARHENITMFAVGITNSVDKKSLRELSSPPQEENKNYFLTPNFVQLQQIISGLVRASCIQTTPKFYPPTTQPKQKLEPGFSQELLNHPAYVVLMMMAVVIVLLFLVAIISLCYY